MTGPLPQLIDSGELPEYPLSADERLDSHYFMAWERRRWLNSDMRLKGTAECRCYYFDLINIAYDQSPVGTLPLDRAVLAKLCHVDQSHFEALCRLDYGPLHRWTPCLCDGEVRLIVRRDGDRVVAPRSRRFGHARSTSSRATSSRSMSSFPV